MKNNLMKYTLAGFFFVCILGSLAHFFYNWSGQNFLIGLVTPVNESVWEHLKLLLFPSLLYALLTYKIISNYPSGIAALFIGIFAGMLSVLGLFYLYSWIFGSHNTIIDILIFYLSIFLTFLLFFFLANQKRLKKYTHLLCLAMTICIICFVFLSIYPPNWGIFKPL